jgi:hygromycin-B 7''-O-kinase
VSDPAPAADDALWLELCDAACLHAGVRYTTARVIATWDRGYSWNAVYELDGRRFLKLYGPRSMTLYRVERPLLGMIERTPGVSAPRIIAAGQADGARPYLIVTGMRGETAEHTWDAINRDEQVGIAREVGEMVAALHAMDVSVLPDTTQLPGSRRETAPMNIAKNCEQIEATSGLPAATVDEFTEFIRGDGAAILAETTCVVHCELTNNHIYLRQEGAQWRLSGLIDFADAMVGAPEFDIAWLWPWAFSRDGEAMRVCLDAVYDGRPRPTDLPRRCLAATLSSYSAEGLWDEYISRRLHRPSVTDMTEWLFPTATFGS